MKRLVEQLDGALVRQAAAVAGDVRDGLRASLNVDEVIRLWNETHRDSTAVSPADARAWAKTHLRFDTRKLKDALLQVYAVGGLLGSDASLQAYAKAKLSKAIDPANIANAINIDWSSWKPGNRAAAFIANPSGGFSRLLTRVGSTLDGLNDTTASRVGTALSAGLSLGLTDEQIASKLGDVIGSSQRALMVATTEMNAAMSIASMDNYQSLGVEQVEWLGLDACDICQPNIDQGPIDLGQEFESGDTEPPGHANCRCSILPVIAGASDAVDQGALDGVAPVEDVATAEDDLALADVIEPPTLESLQQTANAEEQATAIRDYYQAFTHNGFSVDGVTVRMPTELKSNNGAAVHLRGDIYKDNKKVGLFSRRIFAGDSVEHQLLELDKEYQNQGFATAFNNHATEFYKALGITKIEVEAEMETGGYAWAKAGFNWTMKPQSVINRLKNWSAKNSGQSSEVDSLMQRFEKAGEDVSKMPTALEVALAKDNAGNAIGKDLLLKTNWVGEKKIQ